MVSFTTPEEVVTHALETNEYECLSDYYGYGYGGETYETKELNTEATARIACDALRKAGLLHD